ncbi:MAG: histidine kinase dimerization/phospho-acceptor domain-containing protein [Pseudolabrys sp.]
MSEPRFQFGWLNDSRLAAQALSPTPVWLWSAATHRILWANPVAAAIFDAPSPQAAASIDFGAHHAAAVQIARLASTLPQGGTPRLERLRGFGAALGGTLICLCSKITLADNSAAVLVVATERAGKELALPERARRLLIDIEAPAAVFTADGELIEAQAAAKARLGEARDLVALGAVSVASEASRTGSAQGDSSGGSIAMLKLGAGATVVLLTAFTGAATAKPAAPVLEAMPSAPPIVPNPTAELRPRRGSFRFVWQMDADTRFTLGAAEFTRLLGGQIAATLERPWPEVAAALDIDRDGRMAKALAQRDTWSGIVIDWPVDGASERLPIEMSALPVFDRDRQFSGFRGFGICRDLDKIDRLQRQRTSAPPLQPRAVERPRDEEAGKVLPFPAPPPAPSSPPPAPATETPKAETTPPAAQPTLSANEHSAFQELARELSERLKKPPAKGEELVEEPFVAPPPAPAERAPAARSSDADQGRPILERVPVGILVYRLNSLLYANRAFLDWTGYPTLEALANAGGLDSLFIETKRDGSDTQNGGKTLSIATVNGNQKPVEGRLFSVAWHDENALVLMINTQAPAAADPAQSAAAEASLERLARENGELNAILDTATDGVLVLDRAGRVMSANRSAAALFGYDAGEFAQLSLDDLFVPESRRPLYDALERLARDGGGARLPDAGREAIGRVRRGGLVPLFITVGRIEDGDKYCAVLRDVTAWKRNEEDLINARQEAEKASTAKSEFLAKISHEIRTPLNAIIGFSEVMMDERFGPVGNDRYRQYLKDIHNSGEHLISLLNDLLDLSKIEAGKLDLTFVTIDLNDLVRQSVAIMQQEANRERVIIRTSLNANLPPIVADARSVKQIALNILSNSIKFTGAGGQIIVSTAVNDDQEVSLRMRDTGHGMSEKELQTALEPFRQLSTSARWGATGTGLGLPITKALAEANHARFRITSEVDTGTLVEVAFPATRVLAK